MGLKYPLYRYIFHHDMNGHLYWKGAQADREAPGKVTRVALSACQGHRSIWSGTVGLAELLQVEPKPAPLYLKKGHPTYVAVWTEDHGIVSVEIIYAGTHEKAPY